VFKCRVLFVRTKVAQNRGNYSNKITYTHNHTRRIALSLLIVASGSSQLHLNMLIHRTEQPPSAAYGHKE
jgi:hypothetical protein